MKNINKSLYKNLACGSVGLLIIFVTSIFVVKDFYGQKIIELIDEHTLLKDYHYPTWGQFPGSLDATFTHQLTLYNLSTQSLNQLKTGKGGSSEAITPVSFANQFNYKNISYGQGNQGFIKYLHEWDRHWVNQEELKDTKISIINLAAQKVFDYEYLSTESRRFVLMYNEMQRAVRGILPSLYSETLHQYYFHDREVVDKVIFDEMNLDPTIREIIYSHPTYGWNNADNLKVWINLCHSKNKTVIPDYELLQEAIGLTVQQLEWLVGDQSIMKALSKALNGTIKYKIQSTTYLYKECVPFCNDSHLVSIQLSTGLLTSTPLFASVNLNKLVHELNTSIPSFIQYSQLCKQEDLTCIDSTNVIDMFKRQVFGNFTYMSQVIKNKNNPALIENIFGVQSRQQDGVYGRSIVAYINYLQNHIFTAFDEQTQTSDPKAYTYMFPNHIYVNTIIQQLKQTLAVQLYTRALFKSFNDDKISCTSFYNKSPYTKFIYLCQKPEMQITSNISALRLFVQAYFFIERSKFIQQTTMTWAEASSFLRLDQTSQFALRIRAIGQEFKEVLNCKGPVCSSQELLAREWGGDRPILQNLPKNYFPNPVKSILQWDIDNKFNGQQPQYYKMMKKNISQTNSLLYLGSGPQSILVLYNIMKYKLAMDKGSQSATQLVNYVQKVTLDSAFGGIFQVRPLSEVINGYSSNGLKIKRNSDSLIVGTPWLPESVSFVPTKSRPNTFSKINTGIYNKDQLRMMLQVQESKTIGSQYITYETSYQTVKEQLVSDKRVFGTNLLGFHQDIGKDQILSAYLDFIHQGVLLNNINSNYKFKGEIDAYKYGIVESETKTSVGVQEQNQRSIIINSESYFVVEPLSGTTLQLFVKYSVFSKLSFLDYYPLNKQGNELKLYDMQIRFNMEGISDLIEVRDTKSTLISLYIAAIVLATVSTVGVLIGIIMYCYRTRPKRSRLVETLVTSDSVSSSSIKI